MQKLQTKNGRFYIKDKNLEVENPSNQDLINFIKEDKIVPSITNISKRVLTRGIKAEKIPVPNHLRSMNPMNTGTQVHEVIEGFLKTGNLVTNNLEQLGREYIKSFQDFIRDHDITPRLIETVVSGKIGGMPYAGTLDFLGEVNGKRTLLDWKTGADPGLAPAQSQVWAAWASNSYLCEQSNQMKTRALNKWDIESGWVVHLTAGQGYRVYRQKYTEELDRYHRERWEVAGGKLLAKLERDARNEFNKTGKHAGLKEKAHEIIGGNITSITQPLAAW